MIRSPQRAVLSISTSEARLQQARALAEAEMVQVAGMLEWLFCISSVRRENAAFMARAGPQPLVQLNVMNSARRALELS